ncbi:MAG: methyltransferase domain-containing protein [Bacteroidetes bacterium]|nr:methyltransferase domain-containing protein [Bacteroidota bacterium]
MSQNDKSHWDKVYSRNTDQDVGWYQEKPKTSFELIQIYADPKSAIIDIGAGNSNLGNLLIQNGYTDLAIVDISSEAIERSKSKISKGVEKIQFFESNVLALDLAKKFGIWHDRAVFHFLWDKDEIDNYVKKLNQHMGNEGIFILGAFSENGPEKCSGLNVNHQSEKSIVKTFGKYFNLIETLNEDHTTPSGKIQNYIFAVMQKKEA